MASFKLATLLLTSTVLGTSGKTLLRTSYSDSTSSINKDDGYPIGMNQHPQEERKLQQWQSDGYYPPQDPPMVVVTGPKLGDDCSTSRSCVDGSTCSWSGINGSDRYYCMATTGSSSSGPKLGDDCSMGRFCVDGSICTWSGLNGSDRYYCVNAMVAWQNDGNHTPNPTQVSCFLLFYISWCVCMCLSPSC